jgi:hypothetical protein
VALLASIFATTMLSCLGLALVLLGSVETRLAANDLRAQAAAHSAHAALSLAESELRARATWTGVIAPGVPVETCAEPGTFRDTTLQPSSPWDGSSLDLRALTAARQAASDALTPAGMMGPVWRLFEYGPISRLVPSDARRYPYYVVVWAADGLGGTVFLHATAWGTAGLTADVEASVARRADGTSLARLAIRARP